MADENVSRIPGIACLEELSFTYTHLLTVFDVNLKKTSGKPSTELNFL
jgi:hypothetical protein